MSLPELYLKELQKSCPSRKAIDLHLTGCGFKFFSGELTIMTFCGFPQSLQANSETTP